MPLVYDNRNIREVWYGGRRIRQMYAGSTLVFGSSAVRTTLWHNLMWPRCFIRNGRLFCDGENGPEQISEYDDWVDIGLRANGTLWVPGVPVGALSVDSLTVTQVGSDTGWTAVSASRAINRGRLFSFGFDPTAADFASAQQIGELDDWTALLPFGAIRAGKLYTLPADGPLDSDLTGWTRGGGMSIFDGEFFFLNSRSVGICAGRLYGSDGSSRERRWQALSDETGWTDVSGVPASVTDHNRPGDYFQWPNCPYMLYGLAIRDGRLYFTDLEAYADNRTFPGVLPLSDETGWTRVAGSFGFRSGSGRQMYAYAIRNGRLYAVSWALGGSSPVLTRVGDASDWTNAVGESYPANGVYAYALREPGNRLYRLDGVTATLIG